MDIKSLLRPFNLTPKRSLGQNFLSDLAVLDRIASAAEVGPEDAVLEVGPGLGTLTEVLAARARQVVAVELDDRLWPALQHVLAPYPNVHLVHADILETDPAALLSGPYKVVANVPYYITSAILRHLLEARTAPALMVLTVQAEVAERLAAEPGDMSLLAVSVQFYGNVEVVGRVKAGSFYPPPDVDSAIVRVDLRRGPFLPLAEAEGFFRVVRAGFSQRRKQLKNTLAAGLARKPADVAAALTLAGVDPARRAETLSLEEWARIVKELTA